MGRKKRGNNYSIKAEQLGKIDNSKAKATNLAVHFKNTLEAANAIRSKSVPRALSYLKNVIAHKECVPFRKYKTGIGKCAQAKQFKTVIGRWPQKSAKALIDLIKNACSNLEFDNRDSDQYYIHHIQVNQAPVTTRRTYRAHGRINPYVRHRCHVQMILASKSAV